MSRPTVIIFNGPPGCGKDEACRIISEKLGMRSRIWRFKNILIKKLCAYFNVSVQTFMTNYEAEKEVPQSWLTVNDTALSRREALIFMSEDRLKLDFGPSIIARLTCEELVKSHIETILSGSAPTVYIFPDGGFQEEVEHLARHCTVYVVRIHRDGHDFSHDSRSYIKAGPGIEIAVDITNNGTLAAYKKEVIDVCERLIFVT